MLSQKSEFSELQDFTDTPTLRSGAANKYEAPTRDFRVKQTVCKAGSNLG